MEYMSPNPIYERQIPTKNNNKFRPNIENFINDLTMTLDNLNTLMKDLELTHK